MGLCSEWKELGRWGCDIINRRREAKASVGGKQPSFMCGRTGRAPVVWAEFLILSVLRHDHGVALLSWPIMVTGGLCLVLVLSETAYVHLGNKTSL